MVNALFSPRVRRFRPERGQTEQNMRIGKQPPFGTTTNAVRRSAPPTVQPDSLGIGNQATCGPTISPQPSPVFPSDVRGPFGIGNPTPSGTTTNAANRRTAKHYRFASKTRGEPPIRGIASQKHPIPPSLPQNTRQQSRIGNSVPFGPTTKAVQGPLPVGKRIEIGNPALVGPTLKSTSTHNMHNPRKLG